MKTLSRLIGIAALALSTAGCAALVSTPKAISEIKPGMSAGQIKRLMGRPDLRRFGNSYEEWEYQRTISQNSYNVIIIKFDNGDVTGMDSYRVDNPAIPPMHYRPDEERHQ